MDPICAKRGIKNLRRKRESVCSKKKSIPLAWGSKVRTGGGEICAVGKQPVLHKGSPTSHPGEKGVSQIGSKGDSGASIPKKSGTSMTFKGEGEGHHGGVSSTPVLLESLWTSQ